MRYRGSLQHGSLYFVVDPYIYDYARNGIIDFGGSHAGGGI